MSIGQIKSVSVLTKFKGNIFCLNQKASCVLLILFYEIRLKKPTKENLYGETVELSVPEGKEFNTPYNIDDLIESEPPEEFDDDSQIINEKEEKIEKLEEEAAKMENRPFYKNAYNTIKNKIKKLKDEDNQITY